MDAAFDPNRDRIIEMGGLEAELVEDNHASSLPPATSGRMLDKISSKSNPRMALTSPRPMNAQQPTGKWKVRQDLPRLDTPETIGPTLKKILQIMWEPREMVFQPVAKGFSAILTVDCDESSPRGGELSVGERFNVLDLREAQGANGPVIRVRTRHGWFTWGRMTEINAQTDNGGVHLNFKCPPSSVRADSEMVAPFEYAQDMGEQMADHPEAVVGHEDAVWVDMVKVFKKFDTIDEQKRTKEQKTQEDDSVDAWSRYSSSQQERWLKMAKLQEKAKMKAWRAKNGEAEEQATHVLEAAQRDLKGLPFFKNVPGAYLDRLAGTTATRLQRFTKGETIVQFVGGQSFPQKALADEAGRPSHHISAKVELRVPDSINTEDLDAWLSVSKLYIRLSKQYSRQLRSKAGSGADAGGGRLAALFKTMPDDKLKDLERNNWDERQAPTVPEAVSKTKADSEAAAAAPDSVSKDAVLAVEALVDRSLRDMRTHMEGTSNQGGECLVYLVDAFSEISQKATDGNLMLLAILLVCVKEPGHTRAHAPADATVHARVLRAVRRDVLGSKSVVSWMDSKYAVQAWWSWVLCGLGVKDLGSSFYAVEKYLEKEVKMQDVTVANINQLTAREMDSLIEKCLTTKAGLKKEQVEHCQQQVRSKLGLDIASADGVAVGGAQGPMTDYDEFLDALGLLDKKEALAGYLDDGKELRDLEQMDDDDFNADILDDDYLGFDEETKERFRVAKSALPDLPKLAMGSPQPQPEPEPELEPELQLNAYDQMQNKELCILAIDVNAGPVFGSGMLSHKLYVVHSGTVDVYSREHEHRRGHSQDDAEENPMYQVGEGGYFGEMQLLHGCDIHGAVKASTDETLVWLVDEAMFTQFRGLTMHLLETVAARLSYCQDKSEKNGAFKGDEPCYLDANQVKKFKPLVDLKDEDNRSDVPINLYAVDTNGMFGVEELRQLLETRVRFRSLMVKDSDSSADGADIVAEFMRMDRLEHLAVLEIGAGPSDHGICKLVLASLDKRLIFSDGKARMKLFNVVIGAANQNFAHEKSTHARKMLLEKIAKDGAKSGERHIELHRHTDYPLDLAMTFAKFAEQLREELPTEAEYFVNYADEFENMACEMLDECNSEAEVELILRQSSSQRPDHCEKLLEGCRDVLEYSTREPPLAKLVMNRRFAAYVEDLWSKHQVVGRAGLLESVETTQIRSRAEAFAAPMVEPVSRGDWLLCPFKWVVWIVFLPFFTLPFLEAGAAIFALQARWGTAHQSQSEVPDPCKLGCHTKVGIWIGYQLKSLFVYLDALSRIPALIASTWLIWHLIAMVQTTLIAAHHNVLDDDMTLNEFWTYVQACGIVVGEATQIMEEVKELEFLDEGRPFSQVPYHTLPITKWMVEPSKKRHRVCGGILWLLLPVWAPLLRLILAVVNGHAVASGFTVVVPAGLLSAWLLSDTEHWLAYSLTLAVCSIIVVVGLKLWLYGGLQTTPKDFRANLTLRFPIARDESVEVVRQELQEHLKNLAESDAPGTSTQSPPKRSSTKNVLEGLSKRGAALQKLHDELNGYLAKQDDARGLWTSVALPFELPFELHGLCSKHQLEAEPDGQFGQFCIVHVGVKVKVQFSPQKGNQAVLEDNQDMDERTELALDMLVRTENWLLRAVEPHCMPHWSPTNDHADLRLKRVEVKHRTTRMLLLASDAVDGLLTHAQRIYSAHFLDFWQKVDMGVVIMWMFCLYCRVQTLYHKVGDDDFHYWSRAWTMSLALVTVLMCMRALHHFMLSPTLGPLVIMMIKIIGKDVATFSKLFFLLIFAASTALISMYRFDDDVFDTVPSVVKFVFTAAFDHAELEVLNSNQSAADAVGAGGGKFYESNGWIAEMNYYTLTTLIFWVYWIIVNIILLNLLIAMMASTYEEVKQNAKGEWRVQRTRVIREYSTSIKHVGLVPPANLLYLFFRIMEVPFGWCCGGSDLAAEKSAIDHFLEGPTDTIRMWGDVPHVLEKKQSDDDEAQEGQENREGRCGAMNLNTAVKKMYKPFPGTGSSRFADFHDHSEARTPQLALHQRWQDKVDDQDDWEKRENSEVTDNVTRKIEELGKKLGGDTKEVGILVEKMRTQMAEEMVQGASANSTWLFRNLSTPEGTTSGGASPTAVRTTPSPTPTSSPVRPAQDWKKLDYDGFLEALSLTDKKEALAYYLDDGKELRDLTQMDDDDFNDDILNDDDLGIDEETKVRFREAVQALKA